VAAVEGPWKAAPPSSERWGRLGGGDLVWSTEGVLQCFAFGVCEFWDEYEDYFEQGITDGITNGLCVVFEALDVAALPFGVG
jgi:hypothetical protein